MTAVGFLGLDVDITELALESLSISGISHFGTLSAPIHEFEATCYGTGPPPPKKK